MSRTPRHPRNLGRQHPPSARAPHTASSADPATRLRALIEAGIVAAAALNARDDLELAAASTQRLGALTSGMWRALSRELATAAERLDRSTSERIQDIQRRARSLQVDPEEVVAVGVAAAHLAEHRATLETVVQPGEPAQRLLGPNLLLAYSLDAQLDQEEEEEEEEGQDDDDLEPNPGAVDVALFFWPAPLTPVIVSIVPSLLAGAIDTALSPENISLGLALTVPPLLLEPLTRAADVPQGELNTALSSLAIACWTAHFLDEEPPDDDEDEDEETHDEDDTDREPADPA